VQEQVGEGEIDHRRQGRSALHNGESHFHRLLEKLPAGAYTCDPEGLITYYNQRAVQLWGRAPKLNDPADRFCGSFKLFSTDGSPIAHDQCWMALALKTDREYNEREIVIERPDDQRLTALAHANPIHDESGELLGAVNVLVDITDRKRAEEDRQRVREAERSRLARDLHDSVLQDFSYTVASLGLTKINAEGTGLEGELQRSIDALRHAAQGLRAAVNDLRLGEGRDRPFLKMVESLVQRGRAMARGQEIRLEVKEGFPSEPLGETGTELLCVIQEALTNARRHSGAKSVVVSVGMEGRDLGAEVSDDGLGFRPSMATGVGLSSMRERAAAIGGRLEIESTVGQGTRVRIRIPIPQKG
jgi:signal transduction histidine kinase